VRNGIVFPLPERLRCLCSSIGRKARATLLCLLCAAAIVQAPRAVAAGYKCVGSNGLTTYSDVPCNPNADPIKAETAADRTSAAPPGIEIQRAAYISPRNGRELDVTNQLKSHCMGVRDSCTVNCGNQLAGDPDFGQRKFCTVSYRCSGGTAQELRIQEGESLALLCPSGVAAPDARQKALTSSNSPAAPARPSPVGARSQGASSADTLVALVKSGSITQLQTYLSSAGVDINDRSSNDKALLDYAAEQNQVAVANYLVEHGARIDAAQTTGRDRGLTALHRAAYFDAADVAELLLSHGAQINAHGPAGATPLLYAASNGSHKTVKVLLRHGADVSAATGAGQTALSEAASHGHLDIVELLQSHGAAPNPRSLNDAAARGELEAVRYILARDVDTDSKDTALRFAILGGTDRPAERKGIIELLLAHGADINNRVKGAPNTPLMLATTADLVEFLIDHGADVKAEAAFGTPAQALACNRSVPDPVAIFNVLLVHRVDIAVAPKTGLSALHCAVLLHRVDFVEFLLAHGVPVDLPDATGRTALFVAMDTAMIDLLVEHGANVNAFDDSGRTPLMSVIAQADHPDAVATLIEKGADLNAKDRSGNTAFQVATSLHQDAVAQLLLAHGASESTQTAAASRFQVATVPPSGATPGVSTAVASVAVPSAGKTQKAARVLTLLNYQQSGARGAASGADAAVEVANLFLKPLDPANPDWNPQHPQWKEMGKVVGTDVARDLPAWQATVARDSQAASLHEFAIRADEKDLDALIQYFQSRSGIRYLAFQAQIEPLELAGMQALMTGQPVPGSQPSESVLKERMRLLAMGMDMMVSRADYEDAERQHGDISGFGAMPILIQNAALRGGDQLDALVKQFAPDVAAFAAFSDSTLAKSFYAAVGPALRAGGKVATDAFTSFQSQEQALYLENWRRTYESMVKSPASAAAAADATRRAALPTPKPGTVLKECAECPELVVLPAGTFEMGSPETEVGRPVKGNFRANSESPVHQVHIPSFAIGKFEVTRAQFSAFTRATGYGGTKGPWPQPAEFHQEDNHPVVGINAADADAYVRWLARKTGQLYRLPSEAEWEYAARAGTTTSHYWGNDLDSICLYENVRDATAKKELPWAHDWPAVNCADGYAFTAPVGSFMPNPFGLYDMLGNASEIVADCIHDQNYVGAPTDGSAWASGDCQQYRIAGHAMRGGSWQFTAEGARAAARSFVQQDRASSNGLRVARSLP
jgi:formylglycine-generating enzyme